MTEVIVMESAAYQKMMGQIAKIAEFITKNEHKFRIATLTTMYGWTVKKWPICSISAHAPCNG